MDDGSWEFLTQVLGTKVVGLGPVREVLAHSGSGDEYPRVVALVAGERIVPLTALSDGDTGWTLKEGATDYTPGAFDLHLKRDVLDKQIVDTGDARVVRVSDVRLTRAPDGALLVVGVDPGHKAVLRRLLPSGWGEALARTLKMRESTFINWRDVASTPQPDRGDGEGVLRLRTSRDSLRELHPADIADILEQLSPRDQDAVIESLGVDVAADVVTEMEEGDAADLIQRMDVEKAADILEEMEPDDAADLVQDLPGSKRKELLDEMEDEEAEDVKELLTYDEHTAGGMMTTEFVALPFDLTAEGAIQHLRELAPSAETIYYVYVVEPDEKLSGVISLRDLIVAAPTTPLWNIMVENVIHVPVDAPLEEVAEAMDHYDLLALPVVDGNTRIQGIVTVDDALEELVDLLPDRFRRRRSRRN
jgi:magnesium transporter